MYEITFRDDRRKKKVKTAEFTEEGWIVCECRSKSPRSVIYFNPEVVKCFAKIGDSDEER
jgi:hypothetical protein